MLGYLVGLRGSPNVLFEVSVRSNAPAKATTLSCDTLCSVPRKEAKSYAQLASHTHTHNALCICAPKRQQKLGILNMSLETLKECWAFSATVIWNDENLGREIAIQNANRSGENA